MVMEGFYFLQAMLLMVICWGCIGWIILRLFWETKWFIRRMHRRWQQPLEDQQPKQHEQVVALAATFQQREAPTSAALQGVPPMIEPPSHPPENSVSTQEAELPNHRDIFAEYTQAMKDLQTSMKQYGVAFSPMEMSRLYVLRARYELAQALPESEAQG